MGVSVVVFVEGYSCCVRKKKVEFQNNIIFKKISSYFNEFFFKMNFVFTGLCCSQYFSDNGLLFLRNQNIGTGILAVTMKIKDTIF